MKHSVVVAGLGARGKLHVKGILENPEHFELVGIFDPTVEQVKKTSERFNLDSSLVYSSAEEMLEKTHPDILIFVTHPNIRLDYIELGIRYGVKSIALEKPMATSLSEARKITALCREHGIKAVVSHQQKYTKQMQQMYDCVRSGILGGPELIRVFMRGWSAHLATHFIDYALWVNGGVGAEWAVGHVSGRIKLDDNHPSPDYMMGEVRLKNGATLFIECGYLSPFTLPDEKFWTNSRITVYGTHGYSWAETDSRCAIFSPGTGGKLELYQYPAWHIQEQEIQTLFYKELADWLEDDAKVHSCNIETSLHGFEIMEGIYKSALEHTRVDFPIRGDVKDAVPEMKKLLPEQSYPENFYNQLFYKKGRRE